ncbi:MAG: ABC transporter permease [Acidobacteriota bacterium]|nr:ABC transporter permease [Acidobacteriota bacterium]
MIIPKLALRNMLGAGIKTWLNAAVLSMAFVTIIGAQGLYRGWDADISRIMTAAEYGGGQYWVKGFDPYDPFTLQDAHAAVPPALTERVEAGKATALLYVPATIYPGGRIRSVVLKGIEPGQKALEFPSSALAGSGAELPALIGNRMAKAAGLAKGDTVTARWRDARGSYDARDLTIVEVMRTSVQSIDEGQIWMPLQTLRKMAGMPGEATMVTLAKDIPAPGAIPGWDFKGLDLLLKDIRDLIAAKQIGGSIVYVILMFLAMLAVFDTQLLSIWRRRKEIGTMMAMGVTRGRAVALFTLEGGLNGVFAALLGAVWGIPLLAYFAKHGMTFTSEQADSFGMAVDKGIFPVYGAGLVLGTTFLVFAVTLIVSYLPARKISRLKATDALRGRMS